MEVRIIKFESPEVPQEIEEIVEKYGITIRQSQILTMKLNGFSDKSICNSLGISKSTLHRHYSMPKVRLALQSIKAVQLQQNAVTTAQAFETSLSLMLQTMENNDLPIELRLTTAKAVADLYTKVTDGDRQQTLIDAVMSKTMANVIDQREPIKLSSE